MRLSEAEVAGLIASCQAILGEQSFELYLFGSRVDESKRGGDIDLLLVVDEEALPLLRLTKHKLLYEIKSRLGEQRIDLILSSQETICKDAFQQQVMASARLIFRNSSPGH